MYTIGGGIMSDKQNAFIEFENMIEQSWTYKRLTNEELAKWNDTMHLVNVRNVLKGTFKQRWETLQIVYSAFLNGCGYEPIAWNDNRPCLR
jgi:hypothetical protein